MQRHLLKSDSNLWAVMNTVLDGLIIIDKKGIIQTFNPAAVSIFGYQPDEVIGHNVKMLMPNLYSVEHDGYLKNYLDTKNAKVIGIGREVSGKRKNGDIFPMELGVNEMYIEGQLLFVGTVRDISERKNAEKEKNDHIIALNHSNQELNDFAYIASHDLKEPLRGLSNNAQFLKEDFESKLNEDAMKRLDRMVYLCDRMENLIDNLLHFSQIGQQELAIKSTDLNEVIRDIEDMLETTLTENNAKIIISKPLPHITCDVVRVTELFRNLITNAIKYNNKEEKFIEIGCKKEFFPHIFYVKDNGIGIPERFYGDIFRIFKRLNNEDDSVKGTGVGLTFVKKIVERHGGNIFVESKIDEGTTFNFTLEGQIR